MTTIRRGELVRSKAFGPIKAFGEDGNYASDLGPREIRGTASASIVDYCGDIVEAAGADLSRVGVNLPLVDSHDTSTTKNVVGTVVSAWIVNDFQVDFHARFLPEGVSELADTLCASVKSGAIRAVSIGFIPRDWEYLDEPGRGVRFTKWTLIELSLCAVGANEAAIIQEKSLSPHRGSTIGNRALLREIADLRRSVQRRYVPRKPALPDTRAALQFEVAALRESCGVKRVDPRIIAAQAQFRMRSW